MQYMCDYLENEAGENFMSLKAAPYAVEFYKKLGFKPIKPEEVNGGIRVTPMEKAFENAPKI
jgi:predicted GNAT family N-acyltransferase